MRITCELLDARIEIPERPERVVCLTSGATEALDAMGLSDRVVGISSYCRRYVSDHAAQVVGDYLKVDDAALSGLDPDLVLVSGGIQKKLGLALMQKGYPVYALPLPVSFNGILESFTLLSALMNELGAGRVLRRDMEQRAEVLRNTVSEPRPQICAELWFGRHLRIAGGLTFINDLIDMAGGINIYSDERDGYLHPDMDDIRKRNPDLIVLFEEPEVPVGTPLLHREFADTADIPVIHSSVKRGENMIHDGPSLLETAKWLSCRIKDSLTGKNIDAAERSIL